MPDKSHDDAREKFRAALDRKRNQQQPHPSSQRSSKVHESHGAAGGKRTFRRKSG